MAGAYRADTNALRLLKEVWGPEVDVLAYDLARFWNRIDDIGPPGNKGHIALLGNLARFTPVAGSFDNLTFSSNTETEAVFTPATLSVPVKLELNVPARGVGDLEGTFKTAVTMSLTEGVDAACLTDVSSLVTNLVGDGVANLDKPMVADAVQKMATGAKQYFEPGNTNGFCVLPSTQIDDLISITDLTSAQVRGDSVNPVARGWVSVAFGVSFTESTQCQVIGTTSYGVMAIGRAFGVGFNQRPTVAPTQDFDLTHKIIAWTDFAHGIKRDQYAVQMKFPVS
jgi:hypothetical protein